MIRASSFVILLPALLSVALVTPALADDDHDRARDLYSHGDIQGLGDVLKRAAEEAPGDVVAIGLVQRNGVWIYRLDIMGSDGHRRIVEMNASKDEEGNTDGSPTQ